MNEIRVLMITIIGLGLILGLISNRKAFALIARVLLMAALLPIGIAVIQPAFSQLSLFERIITILIVSLIGLVLILRIVLGKILFTEIVGHFLYDVLKVVVLFPFRVLARLLRR